MQVVVIKISMTVVATLPVTGIAFVLLMCSSVYSYLNYCAE